MTKRKVWRYKCDHCGKANCSGAAIKKHEQGCTKNPQRLCGMCSEQWPRLEVLAVLDGVAQRFSSDLSVPSVTPEEAKALVDQLHTQADCCPACMLAGIRQRNCGGLLPWDFAAACKDWWVEIRTTEALEIAYRHPGTPGYYDGLRWE